MSDAIEKVDRPLLPCISELQQKSAANMVIRNQELILGDIQKSDKVARRSIIRNMEEQLLVQMWSELQSDLKSEWNEEVSLAHTPYGQPVVVSIGNTVTHSDRSVPQISFSHDGKQHIGILAIESNLVGIGIDVVYLPRLARADSDYLLRFAKKFMSDNEFEAFQIKSQTETVDSMTRSVAGHFSFMEAASKALGTGLKMGAGMGGDYSLPKQSLGIMDPWNPIDFLLTQPAIARMDRLSATRMEGMIGFDDEYLVTCVMIYS